MNRELIEQVVRDYDAARLPGTDAGLEAVGIAILVEDVFGVVLSDAEIDPAVLADRSALVDLVARRVGAA
jgi:hypothetical protein